MKTTSIDRDGNLSVNGTFNFKGTLNDLKKIIDKLNSVDFNSLDIDVQGEAYEEVIKDIMTGKVFGQFFTQPLIKKLMVKIINPNNIN